MNAVETRPEPVQPTDASHDVFLSYASADARAALKAPIAATGETASSQYAQIYAKWGDLTKSLDWLDTGYRIHDPGMQSLKTDPLLDPVRGQARYRTVFAQLKLPD